MNPTGPNPENLSGGFFLIWHSLFDDPLWRTMPEPYGRIFLELLHRANFKDRRTAGGLVVPRGSLMIGREKFAEICRVKPDQLRGCLEYLTRKGTIKKSPRFGPRPGTFITICNYESYQPRKSVDTQIDTRKYLAFTQLPPTRETSKEVSKENKREQSLSSSSSSADQDPSRAREETTTTKKCVQDAAQQQEHKHTVHVPAERLPGIRRACLTVAEHAGSESKGEPTDKECREIYAAFEGEAHRIHAFFQSKYDQLQGPSTSWWWFVTCAREDASTQEPAAPAGAASTMRSSSRACWPSCSQLRPSDPAGWRQHHFRRRSATDRPGDRPNKARLRRPRTRRRRRTSTSPPAARRRHGGRYACAVAACGAWRRKGVAGRPPGGASRTPGSRA